MMAVSPWRMVMLSVVRCISTLRTGNPVGRRQSSLKKEACSCLQHDLRPSSILKQTRARLGYRSRSSEAVHGGGGGDEIKSRSVLTLLPPLRSAPRLHCCAHGGMEPTLSLSLSLPSLTLTLSLPSLLCRSPRRLSSGLDETLSQWLSGQQHHLRSLTARHN